MPSTRRHLTHPSISHSICGPHQSNKSIPQTTKYDNDHPDRHLALEALATNALTDPTKTSPHRHLNTTVTRWQHLFGLSAAEAAERILAHRGNLTRPRIPDAHWDNIRAEQETMGYDREAYEYELRRAMLADAVPAAEGSGVAFLVELSGPLESAEVVRRVAGLAEAPVVVSGRSVEEGREVELCCVDEGAKAAVLRWAAGEGKGSEPTVLVDPRSLR